MKAKNDKMTARWQEEKAGIAKVRQVKKAIDQVKKDMETAEHDYDLNKLAELKYGRLPELQKQLQELEKEEHAEDRLLKEEVDEDDIAKVVSTWTGIPPPNRRPRHPAVLLYSPGSYESYVSYVL